MSNEPAIGGSRRSQLRRASAAASQAERGIAVAVGDYVAWLTLGVLVLGGVIAAG
jgi:hypothetical protein